nr:glycoside hydrolase domain-containing protein [Antarcticibacterium sp. 1MA-6-2]
MKTIIKITILLYSVCFSGYLGINAQSEIDYSVTQEPWEAGLGNHRAIIEVPRKANAVKLGFKWRRPDKNPNKRQFIIVNSQTGEAVKNIHRIEINNEKCELVFGPAEKGEYFFYYLPFKPDPDWGYYKFGYLEKEESPDPKWVMDNELSDERKLRRLPKATSKEIEARTEFDSFYPMEVVATHKELEQFVNSAESDYIIIPEDRRYPIKMRHYLPLRWIKKGICHQFEGTAQRNEYYTLQVGVYAAKNTLENVRLEFSSLKSSNGDKLPESVFTCFNTHGVDPYGNPFTKQVDVAKGKVQPLWVGVDIPKDTKAGLYTGIITVKANKQPDQIITVEFNIDDQIIANRGDDEPWRHSRLRWLNSTIGIDDQPTVGYAPIDTDKRENSVKLLGKNVEYGDGGLPTSIKAWDTEILASPIKFMLDGEQIKEEKQVSKITKSGVVVKKYSSNTKNFNIQTESTLEFDGHFNYKIKLLAQSDVNLNDFKLEIPFHSSVAEYMMGMGLPGTKVPRQHQAKWSGPQDSFWVGNTYAGLHVELRGGEYHGPLLNLYKPDPPKSWNNEGKGGFSIAKEGEATIATIFSGNRNFSKGEELVFEVAFLITPVKQLDSKSQFTNRYYHDGVTPKPNFDEIEDGVKIINVHHANKYNPYINYPFINTKEMRAFVDEMHAHDLKVKIYYTIRELSNHASEIWALRSLGNEILGTGEGGGYPWLQEHLVTDYNTQWYSPLQNGIDASIINAPGDSRWYNYYLEGLSWLLKNMDIDGLYLDDVTYDRRILKRMRKILDSEKPGSMIDLHSNTGFSKGLSQPICRVFSIFR